MDYDAASLPGGGGAIFTELFGSNEEAKEKDYDRELEEYNLNQAFIACFNTPSGAVVLEHLWDQHVTAIQFDPHAKNPEIMGFFNEGAKSIVLHINNRLKRIGEKPPRPPEPEVDLG